MAIKLIFMGLKLPFLYIFFSFSILCSSETRISIRLLCLSHAHDYETEKKSKKVSSFNSSLLAIQLRLITIVELSRSDIKKIIEEKKCEQRKVADVRERQILSNAIFYWRSWKIVCNFHEWDKSGNLRFNWKSVKKSIGWHGKSTYRSYQKTIW